MLDLKVSAIWAKLKVSSRLNPPHLFSSFHCSRLIFLRFEAPSQIAESEPKRIHELLYDQDGHGPSLGKEYSNSTPKLSPMYTRIPIPIKHQYLIPTRFFFINGNPNPNQTRFFFNSIFFFFYKNNN